MQGSVMDKAFSPPGKRGRKPLVDISGVLSAAVHSPGQWIRYDEPLNRAKSMLRQLSKYEDIEVITARVKDDPDTKSVYVRAVVQSLNTNSNPAPKMVVSFRSGTDGN